ncbi:hypothetical protein AK88_03618 [Plasmodium fragile]|uniref:Schizont-infected cell agglutination extracellular alpha domain-containing protein n=1 Tax=Plasmodium fragile TaxID=5857 RepID=A0A0D9QLW6_PLAFR|nr:uncharacterized protein AK88_03618 [Plasmodium fragile]KJP86706.1 hypothetical protein AK88_03618 [Plasmodium fragile]
MATKTIQHGTTRNFQEYLECIVGSEILLRLYGRNKDHRDIIAEVSDKLGKSNTLLGEHPQSGLCENIDFGKVLFQSKSIGTGIRQRLDKLSDQWVAGKATHARGRPRKCGWKNTDEDDDNGNPKRAAACNEQQDVLHMDDELMTEIKSWVAIGSFERVQQVLEDMQKQEGSKEKCAIEKEIKEKIDDKVKQLKTVVQGRHKPSATAKTPEGSGGAKSNTRTPSQRAQHPTPPDDQPGVQARAHAPKVPTAKDKPGTPAGAPSPGKKADGPDVKTSENDKTRDSGSPGLSGTAAGTSGPPKVGDTKSPKAGGSDDKGTGATQPGAGSQPQAPASPVLPARPPPPPPAPPSRAASTENAVGTEGAKGETGPTEPKAGSEAGPAVPNGETGEKSAKGENSTVRTQPETTSRVPQGNGEGCPKEVEDVNVLLTCLDNAESKETKGVDTRDDADQYVSGTWVLPESTKSTEVSMGTSPETTGTPKESQEPPKASNAQDPDTQPTSSKGPDGNTKSTAQGEQGDPNKDQGQPHGSQEESKEKTSTEVQNPSSESGAAGPTGPIGPAGKDGDHDAVVPGGSSQTDDPPPLNPPKPKPNPNPDQSGSSPGGTGAGGLPDGAGGGAGRGGGGGSGSSPSSTTSRATASNGDDKENNAADSKMQAENVGFELDLKPYKGGLDGSYAPPSPEVTASDKPVTIPGRSKDDDAISPIFTAKDIFLSSSVLIFVASVTSLIVLYSLWKRTIMELHLEVLNECEAAAWENVKDDYLHIVVAEFAHELMRCGKGYSSSPDTAIPNDGLPGNNVPSTESDGTDNCPPNEEDPDPWSCMETMQLETDPCAPNEEDSDPWSCMQTMQLETDPCPPDEDDTWSCMESIQLETRPAAPNEEHPDPWSCLENIQLDAPQSRAPTVPGDETSDCTHWIPWIEQHNHIMRACTTQPWFLQLKLEWKQYLRDHMAADAASGEHREAATMERKKLDAWKEWVAQQHQQMSMYGQEQEWFQHWLNNVEEAAVSQKGEIPRVEKHLEVEKVMAAEHMLKVGHVPRTQPIHEDSYKKKQLLAKLWMPTLALIIE